MSPLVRNLIVRSTLNQIKNFDRFEAPMPPSSTTDEFWRAVDLDIFRNVTLQQYLQDASRIFGWQTISDIYISEVAAALSRIIYHQSPSQISALAGLASQLPDYLSETFVIEGGPRQLPEGLIRLSRATLLLNKRVKRVDASGSGFKVLVQGEEEAREFDAVVVATPLPYGNIEFSGFSGADEFSRGAGIKYQTVVTTYITGKLRAEYFERERLDAGDLPSMIATLEGSRAPFVSIITKNTEADGSRLVAVYSNKRLRGEDVEAMFEGGVVRAEKEWAAYPVFQVPPVGERRMRLMRGLYYVNALEAGMSAIEVGAIAGRNVAGLFCEDFSCMPRGAGKDQFKSEL
jgi:hypothetical protein